MNKISELIKTEKIKVYLLKKNLLKMKYKIIMSEKNKEIIDILYEYADNIKREKEDEIIFEICENYIIAEHILGARTTGLESIFGNLSL